MNVGATTYSKTQIKRAGEVLKHVDTAAEADLLAAILTVDDWRAAHALPLRRVNANLRYYVRKAGVAVPEVTQRLKRFSTVVDKLQREPGMALSNLREYYVMISELFAMRERSVDPSKEFMEQLAKQFAVTRVYFPESEPL